MESLLTLKQKTDRYNKKYVVLSLDGGGVRALMSLKILAKIEEELGKGDTNYKIT